MYKMNRRRQRELFDHAVSGDIIGVVKLILQRLVDVNKTNFSGHTALHVACENGHLRVARYLLDNGADVSYGQTQPLIAAVRFNHYDCVNRTAADPNCHNSSGETPMSVALQKHPNNIQLILLLLQYGAISLESFSDDIAVQLLNYATVKHAKTMQKLIDGNFINLTAENTFLAAFHFTFKRGSLDLAKRILSYDSYPQIEQLYPAAAYYSAKNNWPNILSELIEKRVDVNSLTKGQTPLSAACKEGHQSVVRLLLDKAADPNVPNYFGTTALHFAVDGHVDLSTAEMLLSAGADVNALDGEGASSLYLACERQVWVC